MKFWMAPHDRQVLPCVDGLCVGEPSGCSGELAGVIVVNFLRSLTLGEAAADRVEIVGDAGHDGPSFLT
jgi:hypothetical protein